MKPIFCFLSGIIFVLGLFPTSSQAEEPTLRQLEKAALRYSGTDPAEITQWKSRTRWAAALPQISVGYDQKAATQINNSISDSVSVSGSGVTVGPAESNFHHDQDFNRGFDLRATWHLDEIVFNRDALSISAESRYRSVIRSQVLEELHQTYFERKRLLLMRNALPPEMSHALFRLQIEALEAKLDALTQGTFSKIKGEENDMD